MPPTSATSDPRRVSLRSACGGRDQREKEREREREREREKERGTMLSRKWASRKGRERKRYVPESTSSPLYPAVAHAWRIDRNRRGEFPMCAGVGSYLIHSPRVLPTPRGDYFTADWGSNTMVVGWRKGGREESATCGRITGTAHAPLRSTPEIHVSFGISAIQTDRIDARRRRFISRRRTRLVAFFRLRLFRMLRAMAPQR